MSMEITGTSGTFKVFADTATEAEEKAVSALGKIVGLRSVRCALVGDAKHFANGEIATIEWTVDWSLSNEPGPGDILSRMPSETSIRALLQRAAVNWVLTHGTQSGDYSTAANEFLAAAEAAWLKEMRG